MKLQTHYVFSTGLLTFFGTLLTHHFYTSLFFSGKTTLSLVLAGIQKPNKGNVLYNGKNVYKLKGKEYKEFRRSVQYIMQNQYSAFNPFRKVGDSFKTVISEYKLAKGNETDNLYR